jgi:hypothetical protein
VLSVSAFVLLVITASVPIALIASMKSPTDSQAHGMVRPGFRFCEGAVSGLVTGGDNTWSYGSRTLTAVTGHPLPLMLPALRADTTRHVRRVAAVLEVLPADRSQRSIKGSRPFLVGLGQSPHLVRCQSKISECPPERLTSVDRI